VRQALLVLSSDGALLATHGRAAALLEPGHTARAEAQEMARRSVR